MHQCTSDGAITSGFLGTAMVALDHTLNVVGWTWLYTPCNKRPFAAAQESLPPPLDCPQIDVRLLNVGGRLLATFHGSGTRSSAAQTFVVEHVQMQAQRRRDGTVALRAWTMQEDTASAWPRMPPWLGGRNQALFAAPDPGHTERGASWRLMVMPWLHLVAELGRPQWYWGRRASAFDQRAKVWFEKLQLEPCAQPAPARYCSFAQWPSLVRNESDVVARLRIGGVEGTRANKRAPNLSTTTHLVRVARRGLARTATQADGHARGPSNSAQHGNASSNATGACDAFLGIGHLHRTPSADGPAWHQAARGCADRPNSTFRFGARYTHFFYTLSTRPPHALLATSGEFCMAHTPGGDDCESVQFIAGLAGTSKMRRRARPHELLRFAEAHELVLSWGANDCEAKIGRLAVEDVFAMLRPVEGRMDSCEAHEPGPSS